MAGAREMCACRGGWNRSPATAEVFVQSGTGPTVGEYAEQCTDARLLHRFPSHTGVLPVPGECE